VYVLLPAEISALKKQRYPFCISMLQYG